ncbi:MAG: branched-chain amino acid ABC transporter permease [Spirochaetaceae bacterium]|jgi:branched-chain amino acid transport system permease protein|nr:branched-chain amino acid ABC transporter permease [Spirochaetaceae bacterium]
MKIRLSSIFIPGVLALSVMFIPFFLIRFEVIDDYAARILTLGAVNAVMAVSVNVITGITGQLSIGQAGFMAIGAYSCVFFTLDLGIPIPLSVLLASVVTAAAGFFIGFPTLKLSGDYLAIVTLGFGEIIRVILINLKQITGGANGRTFVTPLATRPDFTFLTAITSLVIIIILLQNFMRSTFGRAILAVREDEIAACSNGIGVFRYKMTGFIIASFIAGIGGCLYAMVNYLVKADIASFNKSIDYLIFVVLGGMGSITGSVLAAYVLTYFQEMLRFLQEYRLLIYPLLLIFVMLFRPQGLLGMRELSFLGFYRRISSFIRRKSQRNENRNE